MSLSDVKEVTSECEVIEQQPQEPQAVGVEGVESQKWAEPVQANHEAITKGHKSDRNNYAMLLLTGAMLLGPFLMGIGINSVGNESPIRSYFAIKAGYTNCSSTPSKFPSSIWSMGFFFPAGGFIGSLLASILVDWMGRRMTIILLCFLMILGALCKILSRFTHFSILFVGRLFDGVATGGFMVATVLLLLESLTEAQSEFFKPLIQVSINAGILCMGIISMDRVAGVNWHLIHIMAILISIILLLAVFFHPESPKYVYSSTRNPEATSQVFKKLRGEYYNPKEVESLKRAMEESSNIKSMSYREFLSNKVYLCAICSCAVLHVGQQLCGINAVMGFAPTLLNSAGFQGGDAGGCIIFAVSVIGSILFAPLITKQPRKMLWLVGFVVMVISFASLMICVFIPAPSGFQVFWLCLFVFIFQIGPGPMVWFISLEVFPPQAIGVAQGICTAFNWSANTLVYLLFPILLTEINIQVLFIFIVVDVIIIVVSVFLVAETSGKTSREVLDTYSQLYGIKSGERLMKPGVVGGKENHTLFAV